MKRHIKILAAMALLPAMAYAKGDISGIALEKGSGDPIAFATVQLSLIHISEPTRR